MSDPKIAPCQSCGLPMNQEPCAGCGHRRAEPNADKLLSRERLLKRIASAMAEANIRGWVWGKERLHWWNLQICKEIE